jgi:hypothetical protein
MHRFFSFFHGSHYVPFKFPMGSHQVPNVFINMFSIAPHFCPICFGKLLSSIHLYRWAKGKELYTSKWNLLFWGASIVSFVLSDGPIKLACCKNKKKTKLNLGGDYVTHLVPLASVWGQKWWPTNLRIKIVLIQCEDAQCTPRGPCFFPFGRWGGGGGGCEFFLF